MARRTEVTLADGRTLIYFGDHPAEPGRYPDRRTLRPARPVPEARLDRLRGDWVMLATHRQDRTFQPASGQCPLCPSADGRLTEIPAPDYEVAVFENRFPTLSGEAAGDSQAPALEQPVDPDGPLLLSRPAAGRCEVVCFSPRHDASFADLTLAEAGLVMAAWADRSLALAGLRGVAQVYCFENRGAEIGVTLSHPHGQIYAFPQVTPRTGQMLRSCARYREQTGRNLFDDLVAAERADGSRVVADTGRWVAFVPYAAHWPYEVHLYPRQRVASLPELDAAQRADFCELYLDLLRRFDRLFGEPAPYISAWHQAPVRPAAPGFALHLELFTMRRAPGRLKYLAGSESGMDAFATDVAPEDAARRLRELG